VALDFVARTHVKKCRVVTQRSEKEAEAIEFRAFFQFFKITQRA
jgi:hypothetical protein